MSGVPVRHRFHLLGVIFGGLVLTSCASYGFDDHYYGSSFRAGASHGYHHGFSPYPNALGAYGGYGPWGYDGAPYGGGHTGFAHMGGRRH